MVVEVGGRPLRFMDTPGHAKHHHCIWDEASRGWFTGDTFGIAYPELHTPQGPYVVPATAPVQFDQEALHASIARLLGERPSLMYLTHYGAVGNPEQLSVQFLAQVDAMVSAAAALAKAPDRHEAAEARVRRHLYRRAAARPARRSRNLSYAKCWPPTSS